MIYLTDRTEIAKAMNFDKFPVLYIDLDNKKYDSPEHPSDFAVGCKCRVAWENPEPRFKDMSTNCTLRYYEGKYSLGQGGCGLHSSFGRYDVLEMAEWANTPLLRCGQVVVIVEDFTRHEMCRVRVMKLNTRKDIHCQTVCTLLDLEDNEWPVR